MAGPLVLLVCNSVAVELTTGVERLELTDSEDPVVQWMQRVTTARCPT
jgi:hypothetical protein